MNPQRTTPAKPLGLIFAAIVLGLFAAGSALSGVFTLVASFAIQQHGLATTPGAPAPPSPQVLTALVAGVAVFELLIAGWAIATIVGLVRLKTWARFSILVIGGLLAFFGITSAAFLALLPAIMAASSQQTPMPAHVMQGMLLVLGLFYTAIAATGVWWLVYFNLRSVKAYFLPQYALAPNPYAYSTAASLATPGGLAYPAAPPPEPVPAGRFAHVPTSIKVIACFFVIAGLVTAVFMFLPVPAFLGGFYLSGMSAHLLYLGYAVWMLLLGVGLFRLDNRARLGTYALTALSFVNAVILLTPWGRARYTLYSHQIQQQMHFPPSPPAVEAATPVFTAFGLLATLVFYGVILYLIERHRASFRTPIEPQP